MARPVPLPQSHPAALAVLVVAMAVLFTVLAGDLVLHGPVTRLDAPISAWFAAHLHPALTSAMLAVSAVHSTRSLCVLAALLGLGLVALRQRHWLPALLLTVPGGLVLNALVKLAFERARPTFDHPLVHLSTFSFPSGHAAGATVFWGFVLVLWWKVQRGAAARTLGTVFACAIVVLTALSRVYLGAHYPSDVLAGIAEGTLWVAACFHGLRTLGRRREAVA